MDVRRARVEDIPAIEELIVRSVMDLMAGEYSLAQRRASIGPLFGVDRRVVEDGTYLVVEAGGRLAGSGGWSFRRTMFGGDAIRGRDDSRAVPAIEPAHIRAFYVDPGAARSGVGSLILRRSETDAMAHGFTRFAMGATLTGRPFYVRHGYRAGAEFPFLLPGGIEFPLLYMDKEATDLTAGS